MTESEALKERDRMTIEQAAPELELTADEADRVRLARIDEDLGYGSSTKQPTVEERDRLLKERLEILVRMMRHK